MCRGVPQSVIVPNPNAPGVQMNRLSRWHKFANMPHVITRAESIAVKVPARLSARRIWGCLILFFSAVAGRSQVAASAARDTRAGHG